MARESLVDVPPALHPRSGGAEASPPAPASSSSSASSPSSPAQSSAHHRAASPVPTRLSWAALGEGQADGPPGEGVIAGESMVNSLVRRHARLAECCDARLQRVFLDRLQNVTPADCVSALGCKRLGMKLAEGV